MNKLKAVALFIVFSLLLSIPALADVAVVPMYAVIIGVPVFALGVIIIALALLIRAIKRRKNR